MNDPTAQGFIDAMNILRFYTLDSQICLEGDALVASIMNNMEVVDCDEEKLEKLGWKLTRRDGKASHFVREFADH
jgi:hypothetical protein